MGDASVLLFETSIKPHLCQYRDELALALLQASAAPSQGNWAGRGTEGCLAEREVGSHWPPHWPPGIITSHTPARTRPLPTCV